MACFGFIQQHPNWSSSRTRMLPSGRKRTKATREPLPCSAPPGIRMNDLAPDTLGFGFRSDGETCKWKLLGIDNQDRAVHVYVIGASGSGKTKFLEVLIHQDILRGERFGVISPHSDLIIDIKGFLACTAEQTGDYDLLDKVVLVDPTDPKYTVVFNVLEPLPGVSHEKQAQEFVTVCKLRWGDSWGPRMESKFRHSLIALSEAGLPLVFLLRFLTVQDFRKQVLEKVSNPIVRADFENFDQLTKRQQLEWTEPITNKVSQFLSDPRIYQMFAHPRSSFSIRDVMDSGKRLLLSTDKGSLGDSVSDLLNGLFMAKVQMAAFSRSNIPESKRVPWTLYCDEFQNFVGTGSSFDVVLSEARKYRLALVMANQTLEQIPRDLQSVILGNTGIQVYFRINRKDAEILAKEGFAYSGYDLKEVSMYGHRYWSLGEEWEKYFETLQRLPPRTVYVSHRIKGGMLPFRTATIEPAYEVLGMEPDDYYEWLAGLPIGRQFLVEREGLNATVGDGSSQNGPETPTNGLRDDERAFLVFITENPDTPVSQVYKALGLSVRKGNQVRDDLKEQGLIVAIETRMGSGGRLAKFVIPTFEALELLGKEPPEGRGGPIHRHVQQMVLGGAKAKGYSGEVERTLGNGGVADVYLERDGQRIAIEVAVVSKPEREIEHIKRCLEAGCDRVFVVFADERLMARTQEAMVGLFSDKESSKVRLIVLTKLSGFF
jgi:hypothetical protein